MLRLLLSDLTLSGLTVISSAIQNTMLVQIIASPSSHENGTLTDRIQTFYGHVFLPHLALVALVPLLLFLASTLLLMFFYVNPPLQPNLPYSLDNNHIFLSLLMPCLLPSHIQGGIFVVQP